MSDVAIRVEGLGKQYRLGGAQERYSTLRDQIGKWTSVRRLLRRARRSAARPTFWALKDVSFEVNRGEVVGIIGRNGAGKSTLLKILSQITEPTEGGADIYGRVSSLLEVGTGFHPELTGRENIYLNGAILGMPRSEIVRKFDEIVAFAAVERFIDTPVKFYSSGMYMRLAFAVAAHLEPEILIVDEVLAVGDAGFQKKCIGKLGDVARGGRTVLFVSHNMAAVQALCQTAILLRAGRVAKMGPSANLVLEYAREGVTSRPVGDRTPLGPDIQLVKIGFTPDVFPSGSGAVLAVELRANAETVIEHLCGLLQTLTNIRAAVVDFRSASGPYRLRKGQTLRVEADVPRLNLVEGEYKVGLFLSCGTTTADFLDLASVQVTPAQRQSGITPYSAAYRGFLELDYSAPRTPLNEATSYPP